MSATLIFGGTFDPVHVGHIRSAQALVNLFQATDLYLVPCQIPPHRPEPAATPADRLNMLRLAATGLDNIFVDDCELDRCGKSYTYDTLKMYRTSAGEKHPLMFIMGSDSWLTLPTWHRWRELTDLAHLIILSRPGIDAGMSSSLMNWKSGKIVDDPAALLASPAGSIVNLRLEQVGVSASQVRSLIHQDESIEGFVHGEVDRYIHSHNLYLATAPSE